VVSVRLHRLAALQLWVARTMAEPPLPPDGASRPGLPPALSAMLATLVTAVVVGVLYFARDHPDHSRGSVELPFGAGCALAAAPAGGRIASVSLVVFIAFWRSSASAGSCSRKSPRWRKSSPISVQSGDENSLAARSRAGVSPIALIAAATFWTWLWGPIGLLLSTPLTVCLVVLGRHVPQLQFLDVALGNRPALTPEER